MKENQTFITKIVQKYFKKAQNQEEVYVHGQL